MVEKEGMVQGDERRSRRKKKRRILAAGEKESEGRGGSGRSGKEAGRTVRISILFTRDIPQSQGRGSENRIG